MVIRAEAKVAAESFHSSPTDRPRLGLLGHEVAEVLVTGAPPRAPRVEERVKMFNYLICQSADKFFTF